MKLAESLEAFKKVDSREEWIEYNVERSLPYYGSTAPVILDSNFINSRNKNYTPLKIILD